MAFVLRDYQKEVVSNVIDTWNKGLPAIVTAPTGAGKTYMGAETAHLWEADYVFVIGPKASLVKWDKVLSAYFEKRRRQLFTYEKWRSCKLQGGLEKQASQNKNAKKSSINQPYLYKVKNKDTIGFKFYPTQKWIALIKNRKVIVIIDEFHMCQKLSQRTLALAAVVRAICKEARGSNPCQSRVLCLSYTPCDKMRDIATHIYLLGFTQQKVLVKYNRKGEYYETDGLDDILDCAKKLTGLPLREEKTKIEVLSNSKGKTVHTKANKIAGNIFLEHIRPHIVFSCVPDFLNDPNVIPTCLNYFCRVDKHTEGRIVAVVKSRIQPEDERSGGSKAAMAQLTNIQQNLELLKRPLYIQIAKEYLVNNPNLKVVVEVLYLDTMDIICEALKEYNPVRIQGKLSAEEREVSINKFNKHDLECRVLVATLQTGGVSIDLHDTSPGGQFPRLILIPPTFSTKPMVQATGRVFRDSVTSKGTIMIVYTSGEKGDNAETRFYEMVREKTGVIKKYHAEKQESKLPCNYEDRLSALVYDLKLEEKYKCNTKKDASKKNDNLYTDEEIESLLDTMLEADRIAELD